MTSEGQQQESAYDPTLLAAFRHCFQRLIDKFRAYRPLMSLLKEIYDSFLDGWSTQ